MNVVKYRERLQNEAKKRALWDDIRNLYLREIAINLYGILQELKKHE